MLGLGLGLGLVFEDQVDPVLALVDGDELPAEPNLGLGLGFGARARAWG